MVFQKKMALLLFLISTVALMACGGQSNSGKAAKPAPPVEAAPVPAPAPTPAAPEAPDERVPGEAKMSQERLCMFRRIQAAVSCKSKSVEGFDFARKRDLGDYELHNVKLTVVENGTFTGEILKTNWCEPWLFRPNCRQKVRTAVRGLWDYENDRIRLIAGGKTVLGYLDVQEKDGKVETEIRVTDPAFLIAGMPERIGLSLSESCTQVTTENLEKPFVKYR